MTNEKGPPDQAVLFSFYSLFLFYQAEKIHMQVRIKIWKGRSVSGILLPIPIACCLLF